MLVYQYHQPHSSQTCTYVHPSIQRNNLNECKSCTVHAHFIVNADYIIWNVFYLLDTLTFGETIYVFDEDDNNAKLSLSVGRPLRENITVNFAYIDLTTTGNPCM